MMMKDIVSAVTRSLMSADSSISVVRGPLVMRLYGSKVGGSGLAGFALQMAKADIRAMAEAGPLRTFEAV
jgi:hypothetical protein